MSHDQIAEISLPWLQSFNRQMGQSRQLPSVREQIDIVVIGGDKVIIIESDATSSDPIKPRCNHLVQSKQVVPGTTREERPISRIVRIGTRDVDGPQVSGEITQDDLEPGLMRMIPSIRSSQSSRKSLQASSAHSQS